jgi:hypothetical protein
MRGPGIRKLPVMSCMSTRLAQSVRRIVWLTDVMNCGTVVSIMCCTTKLWGYALLRVVAGSCRSMLLRGRSDAPVPRSSVFVVFMVLRQSVCWSVREASRCRFHRKKATWLICSLQVALESLRAIMPKDHRRAEGPIPPYPSNPHNPSRFSCNCEHEHENKRKCSFERWLEYAACEVSSDLNFTLKLW